MTEQPTTTTPPALPAPASAEQAADLASLRGKVTEAEPAPQGDNLPAKVEEPATAEDVFNVLQAVRDGAAPAIDAMGILTTARTEAIWTDKALMKIAVPLTDLMRRHGLGIPEAMDKWGPYVMLAVGLWGPAMATWQAMKLQAQEQGAANKGRTVEAAA